MIHVIRDRAGLSLAGSSASGISTDPSIKAYRDSAGAFRNGESVESKVYELHRVHRRAGGRAVRPNRTVTRGVLAVIVMVVVATSAGCFGLNEPEAERTDWDAITADIQAVLAERPDVASAEVGYQNLSPAAQALRAAIPPYVLPKRQKIE
ncbi:hypothetical protein ABGB07_23175 [Micromonosporaceae bacterium B7E4]